eukprot:jgi/Mesvir1/12288/Mv00494-RA.1
MGRLSVTCNNSSCFKPATKKCSACQFTRYCSKQCLALDHSIHKLNCKEIVAWEERTSRDAPPLNLSQAAGLVASVSAQLDGQDDPAEDDSNGSPLDRLQAATGLSFKNRKTLGKAGACEVLASALDRALAAGNCLTSHLYDICSGMVALTHIDTCPENGVTLSKLGSIPNVTRVLLLATAEGDWPLAERACCLLSHLALLRQPSHCRQFADVSTYEAVAACLVAAASCPKSIEGSTASQGLNQPPTILDRTSASYAACDAVHDLQLVAQLCRDPGCPRHGHDHEDLMPGCQNRLRLGTMPGLPAALAACLHTAFAQLVSLVTGDMPGPLANATFRGLDQGVEPEAPLQGLEMPTENFQGLELEAPSLGLETGECQRLASEVPETVDAEASLRQCLQSDAFRGALADMVKVCQGIYMVIQPRGYPADVALAFGTQPHVARDLAGTLALAGSPHYLAARPACDPDWLLLNRACKLISSVVHAQVAVRGGNVPLGFRDTVRPLLELLELGNRERQRSPQFDAVTTMVALAGDAWVAEAMVEEGVCEALVEAMRQGVDRRDVLITQNASNVVRMLSSVPAAARQLASCEDTCQTLVDALLMTLILERVRAAKGGDITIPLPAQASVGYSVAAWLPIMAADPRCKTFFLTAGAEKVLAIAFQVAMAALDAPAMALLYNVKEAMHGGL